MADVGDIIDIVVTFDIGISTPKRSTPRDSFGVLLLGFLDVYCNLVTETSLPHSGAKQDDVSVSQIFLDCF